MTETIRKIGKLLDAKQKKKTALIVVLLLIGGVLETLGIALLVPVITVVIDPQAVADNKYHMGDLYRMLHMESTTQFAVLMMVMIIAVFVVKNLFLFFQTKVQLKFIYENQFATSRRMMINFMRRPYEYYLNADTSVIQRNITSDINNVFALLLTLLQLLSEVIVFVFLVIALLIADARLAISIAALLVAVLLIVKTVIKPTMIKAGEDNQNYYSGLYKWIEESVMAIKEIKIGAKEDYFIEEYAKCGNGYVNAVQKYNLFNSTPRLLIETVCIAGLIGYLLVMIVSGTKLTDIMPVLSAFVAAAVRLLPSANRINNYLTNVSYFQPFLNNVSENLQEEIHDTSVSYEAGNVERRLLTEKLPVRESIELKNITFRYPNTEQYIFKNASLSIPVGKSVGIVGTSGAGKTTIVDILLGLLHPEEGEILADGKDVMASYDGWLKNIGYIPQTIFMLDSTIRKNVAFGIPDEQIDDEKVRTALSEAQLTEHVESLPDKWETTIGERGIRLSGGQRQRIGIARALYEDPEVLVLDEATSALDNETEKAIMDSINHLHGKKTLIIIAHRLQTIEQCDIVYRVENGQIVRER
ncbi:MAG: ABC transporter ATP-binding protein [Lachnospiraceae bacterium]|nr:ABC transporter ATP-binding protein [Lachnospiraceae bacterium]